MLDRCVGDRRRGPHSQSSLSPRRYPAGHPGRFPTSPIRDDHAAGTSGAAASTSPPRGGKLHDVVINEGRLLQILLRVGGIIMLLATFAIFMPVSWMASSHDWLGMGEFPESPLVDYLTRSISFLYAVHGGLLLLVSSNLQRYRPILLYLGIATAVGGLLLTGIDLHAGMPTWWTATEGPPVALIGILITWLILRSSPSDEATS